MAVKAKIQIIDGALAGTKYGFEEPMVCLVGRSDDCEIFIPKEHAPGISKYHCQIRFDENGNLTVKDLESSNGTFINNVDIARDALDEDFIKRKNDETGEFTLLHDDMVHVGGVNFQVERVDEPESEPACEPQAPQVPPVPKTSKIPKASRPAIQPGRMTKVITDTKRDPGRYKSLKNQGTRTQKIKMDDETLKEKARSAGEKTLVKIARIEQFKEKSMFIPNYNVLRKLGEGSMGLVYLVENKTTGDQEALKLLIPDKAVDDEEKERFFNEIHSLRVLDHPNIISVFNSGVAQGTFYFTMEYCDGGDLDYHVVEGDGPLPYEDAFKILLECLNALDYAHSKGLVHRDIKPDNIFLVQRKKKGPSAKIGDFGVAKALEIAGLRNAEEFVFGTLAYIPRRQLTDHQNITPELDIWSLTASFYFMLTGHTPRKIDMQNPVESVLNSNPTPISKHNPDIPETMAAFIDDVLASDQTFMFHTVKEYRSRLLDFF